MALAENRQQWLEQDALHIHLCMVWQASVNGHTSLQSKMTALERGKF